MFEIGLLLELAILGPELRTLKSSTAQRAVLIENEIARRDVAETRRVVRAAARVTDQQIVRVAIEVRFEFRIQPVEIEAQRVARPPLQSHGESIAIAIAYLHFGASQARQLRIGQFRVREAGFIDESRRLIRRVRGDGREVPIESLGVSRIRRITRHQTRGPALRGPAVSTERAPRHGDAEQSAELIVPGIADQEARTRIELLRSVLIGALYLIRRGESVIVERPWRTQIDRA